MDDDVNDGSIINDSITNGNDAGGHDDASGQQAEERNRVASVATRAKDRWTPVEGLELRLASPLPSSAFWGADPTIVKHPQCR
ncbi:hypothetical protein [Bifidobacterium jacchi]|uniref:Uncharacterized protein n=1 Tax=Bifidobacterium jacchi TaxID=2490545 RepID=A0A5N5RN13_9BIFI|nr:hypothetical protein [Bifidobacterium jacchi]KAB5608678.1 hypothetical protein EHS19_00045 [Bifidobacterium jacchi]